MRILTVVMLNEGVNARVSLREAGSDQREGRPPEVWDTDNKF